MSIHTLIAAAHRLVHDLAAHHKKIGTGGAFLLDGPQLEQWGFDPQQFKKAIRAAETFFKHAVDDADDTYTLSQTITQSIFFSAIHCYRRLVKDKSELMGLFMMWLAFQTPDLLNEPTRERFADIIKGSKNLSRPAFFKQLRPLSLIFYQSLDSLP